MFILDQVSVYAELDLDWLYEVVCIGDADTPLHLYIYYV